MNTSLVTTCHRISKSALTTAAWLHMPNAEQMPVGGIDVDQINMCMPQDHNRTDRAKRFKKSLVSNAHEILQLTSEELEELIDKMFEAMDQKGKSWSDFCYGKHWKWLFRQPALSVCLQRRSPCTCPCSSRR